MKNTEMSDRDSVPVNICRVSMADVFNLTRSFDKRGDCTLCVEELAKRINIIQGFETKI